MLVLFTVKDRIALLPYFIRYYQSIGASRFICCLFTGRRNPIYPEIEAWESKVDLEIRDGVMYESVWCGPTEAEAIDHIRSTLVDRWHVIADLDEFYWLPKGTTLQHMAAKLEAANCEAASCHLIDRIAADGSLVYPGETLDGTYPLACNLTRSIGAAYDKVAVVKPTTPLISGHHGVKEGTRSLAWGEYHHFKWLPGILEIIQQRSIHFRELKIPWAEEGYKTSAKFTNSKLNLNDPALKTWPAPLLGI